MSTISKTAFDVARAMMRAEQDRNPILDTADAYRAALARMVDAHHESDALRTHANAMADVLECIAGSPDHYPALHGAARHALTNYKAWRA